jgi:multidrug transporter EmrE-like cation transporter
MAWFCVALSVLFTVCGRLVVKRAVVSAGPFPASLSGRVGFIVAVLADPWVWTALAAGFLAAVSWMVAMTQLPLSHAYPFMSLALVLVFVASAVLFHESVSTWRIVGMGLIVVGLVVIGR